MAYNLYWAWHPRTRGLWSLIDRTAWTRYRNPIPVISGSTDWSRLLDDAKFLAEYHDVLAEFDQYMANGSDHWFQREYGDALDGPIAYFCAEYGLHESLGIYSGGLGVLAGDHMKSASDMALPAARRRAAVSQGLLPPVDRRRRPPGAQLPRLRPLAPAAQPRPGPERAAADGHASSCRAASWSSRSGSPRSAGCRSCCSTRTCPRTTSRTARSPTSCTSAAARCGSTRSWSSASAASGRSGPSGSSRPPGTSTRATPRSCSPSGPASSSPRATALDGAWTTVRTQQRLHDPHAGLRRERAVRRRPRAPGRRPAARRRRRADRPGPRAWAVGTDGDRSQFDMTAFSLRLTNGANAVSQLHAETANGTWTGVTDHEILGITNGVHGPTWIGAPDRGPARALPRRRPRRPRLVHAAGPLLGARRAHPGTRAVGGAPPPEARAGASSRRAGCAASSPGTARRRPCWPSSMPRSTRRS